MVNSNNRNSGTENRDFSCTRTIQMTENIDKGGGMGNKITEDKNLRYWGVVGDVEHWIRRQ